MEESICKNIFKCLLNLLDIEYYDHIFYILLDMYTYILDTFCNAMMDVDEAGVDCGGLTCLVPFTCK